ncbi:MAG: iron-containing alcohol dehydrogenase [Eubacteriales bacterium]|nr:iron-containing alcohol dehydrogenase [Eubacteriales bacterium]
MSEFLMPRYVYTGKGALEQAAAGIAACGSRALVVTGRHVGRSPMMGEVRALLEAQGIGCTVFDGITGEPTVRMIEEGVSVWKESGCDFAIGLGGGSPLDAAKAIAAAAVMPGGIAALSAGEPEGPVPPIVAIPTTAGTGSEVTRFTVITDQDRDIKMLLKGEKLIPRIAVVDPSYSEDMPKSVTAATGLDALTHAVEAYTSRKAQPLTDALAVSAVRRITAWLPRAYASAAKGRPDPEAREQMAMAALEAGICINNSSVTLVHGMSRPIGALFHVSHGISNAMLLRECLTFALDGAMDRFAALGRAVGAVKETDTEQEAARRFLETVDAVISACEVPTLGEYGIDREAFEQVLPKMARDAMASGSPANTRKPLREEDLIGIYRRAY